LTTAQVEELHALYQNEWWTCGRTLEETRVMLAHTDLVFAICESGSGRLAAFARVLTDRVFKAFIYDVIVAPPHRGNGLGARLMNRILEHPSLRPVKHLDLNCRPELTGFYARFGFTSELGGTRQMRREAPR